MNYGKKVVFISGCSSGIGFTLANEFLKNEYNVYATARKLKSIEKLKKKGINTVQLDVTDSQSIDICVKKSYKGSRQN